MKIVTPKQARKKLVARIIKQVNKAIVSDEVGHEDMSLLIPVACTNKAVMDRVAKRFSKRGWKVEVRAQGLAHTEKSAIADDEPLLPE